MTDKHTCSCYKCGCEVELVRLPMNIDEANAVRDALDLLMDADNQKLQKAVAVEMSQVGGDCVEPSAYEGAIRQTAEAARIAVGETCRRHKDALRSEDEHGPVTFDYPHHLTAMLVFSLTLSSDHLGGERRELVSAATDRIIEEARVKETDVNVDTYV